MYDLGQQFRINQNNLKVSPDVTIIREKYRIQVLTERLIRIEYN